MTSTAPSSSRRPAPSLAERPIPTPILIGGGALMAVSLMAVASVRHGWAPHQAAPVATAAQTFDFRVEKNAAGDETVVSARSGRAAAFLPAKGGDFLPTLFDKLAQERAVRGAPASEPLRLTRWSDGRVSLEDPATGRVLQLGSFGSDNEAQAAAIVAEGVRL